MSRQTLALIEDSIARLRRRLPAGDAGLSVVELVVGMTIMGIFLAIFTTAMFLMTGTSNKVSGLAATNSQLSSAFLTLDRQVRYATGVSKPAYVSSLPGWSVAFSSLVIDHNTPVTATQTVRCTQLRTFQNQLWQRYWTVNSTGGAVKNSGTDWRPIASQLDASATAASPSTPPFTIAVASGSGLQQLTINLKSTTSGTNITSSSSSVSYTALNSLPSSGTVDPATVCPQVAPGAVKP